MRSFPPSLMQTHTCTEALTRRSIMQNTHTHTYTTFTCKHRLCFWNHAGAVACLAPQHRTMQLHSILALYSGLSRLNYSQAEWTSKRKDKRPSSFWNRFNMFVLFPACLWAGRASEMYDVLRFMKRITVYIIIHPANHSYTSVLTFWVES